MLFKRLLVHLRNLFDLHEDKELEHKTIEEISRNIYFRGTRLWVLAFAILIASIGLNMNSTAVVIGAMLISPLMGPIVGTGLALGINDFGLLKRSLLNLLNATFISFAVSSLYFYITPISIAQSEILARTTPTIYDVLIAFFGGMAGIIGSSRREKGVIIPGVAIATALMPPLCTAGYGFATGQYNYLFGAFYLYLINCTFISLATFLMVKYLGYTKVQILDKRKARRMRWYITGVMMCMLVPSTYFAYQIITRTAFEANAERYIRENFTSRGFTLIYKKIVYRGAPSVIELAFLDQVFKPSQIDSFQLAMQKYSLGEAKLLVRQKLEQFTDEEWMGMIRNLDNNEEKIRAMEAKIIAPVLEGVSTKDLEQELRAINRKIDRIAYAGFFNDKGTRLIDTASLVIIYKIAREPLFSNNEAEAIRSWLKIRLHKDTVVTVFQNMQY